MHKNITLVQPCLENYAMVAILAIRSIYKFKFFIKFVMDHLLIIHVQYGSIMFVMLKKKLLYLFSNRIDLI